MFLRTPSIVQGFRVTGFTNSEEEAVGLTNVVPFSVENMLKKHKANFAHGPDWAPFVVTDNGGLLITGQNPASSRGVAKELLKSLKVEQQ